MGLRFHPNELSSAILNIVTKCCNMDPNRRPKAADLLNDSWLKQCPKIRQSANTIMNFKNHSCYSQCHAVNRIHSTGPIIIKNTFSVSGIWKIIIISPFLYNKNSITSIFMEINLKLFLISLDKSFNKLNIRLKIAMELHSQEKCFINISNRRINDYFDH